MSKVVYCEGCGAVCTDCGAIGVVDSDVFLDIAKRHLQAEHEHQGEAQIGGKVYTLECRA